MLMKQAGNGRENGQAAPAMGDAAADLAVGRRLRALRHARGLSLKAVAARTGLSIGFLSQVERGLSSPSLRVLTQIADVLEVGLSNLFGAASCSRSRTRPCRSRPATASASPAAARTATATPPRARRRWCCG
jgi:transcriptional regulator with XRE-family HTH domain